MARPCLGVGVARVLRDEAPVLIAPVPTGDGGGRPAAWAGASAGPDAPDAPRAAGDEFWPASPAKHFGMTGIGCKRYV